MKKFLNMLYAIICFVIAFINTTLWRVKIILTDRSGEGFVDTAIKILMAVVIGALVLAGLYVLFSNTVLPTLTQRVKDMFDYAG